MSEVEHQEQRHHVALRPGRERRSEARARLERALQGGHRPHVAPLARTGDPWTREELTAVVGRLEGETLGAVARRMGRPVVGTQRAVARAGYTISAIKRASAGLTGAQVAEALGVQRHTVASWFDSGDIPITRVRVQRRKYRVVEPEQLLTWLEERGALYALNPRSSVWREIVEEARSALLRRLVRLADLTAWLAVTPAAIGAWRRRKGFPAPALQLHGQGGALYDRAAVVAWLTKHPGHWTAYAREVLL